MAQTNFTPIYLYNSGMANNTPLAANLGAGELAINYTDGKLFYKDNSSSIQVIGWKTTPTTAGGTGLTSYTTGDLPYYASGTTLSKLGIGTSGYVLESNGSAPTWVAQSTLSVGTATNANNVATTDNTSSSSTYYPTLVSATSGNNPITTSSTKFSFVPSTGVLTTTGHNLTGLTASSAVATDGSKNLVSVTNTGTGNNVLATSPTITTPTISGNLSFASGTSGIIFNNTNASVNSTLNDYEVGTFTPSLITDGSGASITYSTQVGKYVKIGNAVFVEFEVTWSARSGGSGNVLVSGFPFGIADTSQWGVRFIFSYAVGIGIPSNGVIGYFTNPNGATALYIYAVNSNNSISSTSVTGAGGVAFKGFYQASF